MRISEEYCIAFVVPKSEVSITAAVVQSVGDDGDRKTYTRDFEMVRRVWWPGAD